MNRNHPASAPAAAPNVVQAAADQHERSQPPSGDNSRGRRNVEFRPTTYDATARTVEIVLSTGAAVRRWSFTEELEISATAIDLNRVVGGTCMLLDTHNQYQIEAILGRVLSARVEAGQLIGLVKFGDTDQARRVEGMVERGELRGTSIGYVVSEWSRITVDDGGHETWRATRWELLEASFVSVPADASAGVRSASSNPGDPGAPATPHEDPDMIRNAPGGAPAPAQNPAPAAVEAERAAPVGAAAAETRAAPAAAATTPLAPATGDASAARMSGAEAIDFGQDAALLGADAAQVRAWVETMTPDAARAALMRHAADRQRAAAPLAPAMSSTRITVDERDTMRAAIGSALMHRFAPSNELSEAGREYRGMTLMEIARRNLERNGERVSGLSKRELADMALRQHSTSDFPVILSNVTGKTLRQGYTQAPQTFKVWQRRASAPDFKQISRLQMGSAPGFLLVPEGGAFKMGTIGEGKEVYALATYGRKFSITRQTLINDDLDAFSRIPAMFGAAAARFESDAAYAPLIANPNMSDGVALFHADHGNLAGSGAVISETTANALDIAMGAQVGLGGEVLNLEAKYLIMGRKDKMAAQKLVKGIAATKTGDVNTFENSYEIVVESRLNRTSGAQPWFAAADYNQVDTIEYAYLEGDDGVFLDERIGFDVDGMEFKARLDFAVKAIDHRGLYMNPGTAP